MSAPLKPADYHVVDQGTFDPDTRYEVIAPDGACVGFVLTKREARELIKGDIAERIGGRSNNGRDIDNP